MNSGIDVPVYIIGDSASSLSTLLMKPFDHNTTHSPDIIYYNYRISRARRARIASKNAFDHLEATWHHLLKQNDILNENVPMYMFKQKLITSGFKDYHLMCCNLDPCTK